MLVTSKKYEPKLDQTTPCYIFYLLEQCEVCAGRDVSCFGLFNSLILQKTNRGAKMNNLGATAASLME